MVAQWVSLCSSIVHAGQHWTELALSSYNDWWPSKGTGLGLSTIYGIKMHRGDIQVNSAEGQGVTVTVMPPVRLPDLDRALETRATE